MALAESIFEVFDANWNEVGVSWVGDVTVSQVDYLDFEEHSSLLENILGQENVFSKAAYFEYDSNLIAIDTDKDSSIDAFIKGVVSDQDWQEILDPISLEGIGGIFRDPMFDFVRLPSDLALVKAWSNQFTTDLLSLQVVDRPDINEDDVITFMSEELNQLLDKNQLSDLNLDVQVHFYKAVDDLGEVAVGLRFMNGDERFASLWIQKEAFENDLADYSIIIDQRGTDSDLILYTNSNVYSRAFDDLIATVEL